MNNKRKVVIIIFIAAMLLRSILCILNRQANDDHVSVVNWIADKHTLPQKADCWSCYQPKLYYIVCAELVTLFHVHGSHQRIEVMQLVNLFISFFILLLFWKFIEKQPLSPRNKLLVFAFFAFNPCLTGINVQGTNDTPAIVFGVLAVYAADSFFKEMKITALIVMLLALIAGAVTKASVIVLTGVVIVMLALKIIAESSVKNKLASTKYLFVLLVCFFLIVPFAGEYYQNYKQHGTLNLSTWNRDARPYFFKTTPVYRPGLQNMLEGFFTFRYFDMLRQPYINNERDNYPMHRTSLWSQLYGRTVFMHFDQWPPAWQTHNNVSVNIGRILIALGIIPLIHFLIGLISSMDFVRHLFRRDKMYLAASQNYLHFLVTIAFLCASVFYTYNFRDFSSMKSIYIFPGLLSFIKLVCDGLNYVKNKVAVKITERVLMAMVIVSVCDIGFLICQLR